MDITTEAIKNVEVDVITLTSGDTKAVLTNLGARLLELHIPDRNGELADVVLQRRTIDEVATDDNYMGSTAGRYANRISNGALTLDGQPVQLTVNEGRNHLHGGLRGFDRKLWHTQPGPTDAEVTFWHVSPDGDEGYPGTLTCAVTYRLDGNSLSVDIRATTDASTIVNIVHHSYFNLAGHDSGTVLDHVLQMNSSHYTPVDDDLLTTGEVRSVADTPFDFRAPTPIGKNIADVTHSGAGRVTDTGVGYDHNWVLDGSGMRDVLHVTDPSSGRSLTMATNQPGVQLYVGGYLEGVSAKGGGAYPAFAGFTLETQVFPDSPHHAHFPQALLHPGETYLNRARFSFTCD